MWWWWWLIDGRIVMAVKTGLWWWWFSTQLDEYGLCSRWQLWNDAWHGHGGRLFRHWPVVTQLCLPFLLYNHYIKYIYLIYDYITSPGSRCLMGSKQCSLWICTGLFDIGKRNLGSTSSRVEVLLLNVLPSFPPFFPSQHLYWWRVSISFGSCLRNGSFPPFHLLYFHSLIDLNVKCLS